MTHPPCPTCGRPSWKAHGGMGGHIMPDAEEFCVQRGGMFCRAASAGRQAALRWRPMSGAPRFTEVLVAEQGGGVCIAENRLASDECSDAWYSGEWDIRPPLAWLPIPEPPKEGT